MNTNANPDGFMVHPLDLFPPNKNLNHNIEKISTNTAYLDGFQVHPIDLFVSNDNPYNNYNLTNNLTVNHRTINTSPQPTNISLVPFIQTTNVGPLSNNYKNNRNIETVETQLLQNPHFTPIMPSNAETHQNNAISYVPFPLNNEIYPNQVNQNLINPNNINQNQALTNTYNIVNLPNTSILDQPQYIANNNKVLPYSTASYEPDINASDYQTRAGIGIGNLESYANSPPIGPVPQKTLITRRYSAPKRIERLKTTIIIPKKKTIIIPKKTVVIVPKARNTLLNIQNNPVIQSQYVPQIVTNNLITSNNNLAFTPLSPSLIPINNPYSTYTIPGLSRTSSRTNNIKYKPDIIRFINK